MDRQTKSKQGSKLCFLLLFLFFPFPSSCNVAIGGKIGALFKFLEGFFNNILSFDFFFVRA